MKAIIFYNLKLFQKSKMPREKATIKNENKLNMLSNIMESAIERRADFVLCLGSFFEEIPSFFTLDKVYGKLKSDIPVFANLPLSDAISVPKNVKSTEFAAAYILENFGFNAEIKGHSLEIFNKDGERTAEILGSSIYEKTESRIEFPQVYPCFCGTETGGFITAEISEDGSVTNCLFTENPIKIIQISARDQEEFDEKIANVHKDWGVNLTIYSRYLEPYAREKLDDFFHYRLIIEDDNLLKQMTQNDRELSEISVKSEFMRQDLPENVKKLGAYALEYAEKKKKP